MSRRLLILLLPALALVVWLVAAQLPRWTAPQPNWFAPGTPGVCAAVDSLKLYGGTRASITGIGREAAQSNAAQVVFEHYDFDTSAITLITSNILEVQATLPDDQRRAFYVVTMALSNPPLPKAAVIYLDAESGAAQALITATDDPSADCDFSVREALVTAIKSPPLLLLIAYVLLAVIVLVARLVAQRIAMRSSNGRSANEGRHR